MKKKTGLALLLLFAAILVLSNLFVLFALEPFVKHRIEQRIFENNKGLSVKIGKLDIKLLAAKAYISQVKIGPDTLGNTEDINRDSLTGSIKEMHISGINFLKVVFQRLYKIDEIHITDLTLLRQRVKQDSMQPGNPFSGIILPANFDVNRITFSNTSLTTEDLTGQQAFRNISMQLPSFTIEDWKHKKNDTLTSEIYGKLHYEISICKALTQDSLYALELHNLEGDSSRLTMDSILLIPQYPNYTFTAKKDYEISRIDVALAKVSVDRLQLYDFLDQRDIRAGVVTIEKMEIDAFRDKRKRDNILVKPMMQELLLKYEPMLKIDTMKIMSGHIVYTEHAEKARVPGKIYFTQIAAQWLNITNDTSATAMQVDVSSLLMNKSRFDVAFTFPLQSKQNRFTVTGKLSSIDLTSLHSILEKNVYVFATGQVQSLEFHFVADNYAAKGNLTVLYNDLHVKVKNPETNETTALKERFASFLANFEIINHNLAKSNNLRKGIIDYQRDPQKFIINYSFKAILSGLKSTILKSGKREVFIGKKKRKE